jgi:hypothetical protein
MKIATDSRTTTSKQPQLQKRLDIGPNRVRVPVQQKSVTMGVFSNITGPGMGSCIPIPQELYHLQTEGKQLELCLYSLECCHLQQLRHAVSYQRKI